MSDSFRSNYLKINPQITHTLEQLKPSNQDLQCEEKEEEEKEVEHAASAEIP